MCVACVDVGAHSSWNAIHDDGALVDLSFEFRSLIIAANRLMWSPTVSHSYFAGTLTLTWEVLLNSEEIDFETRYLKGKSISLSSVQTSISSE